MKKILVATDFSVRSDRAIRRAVLLAKTFDASIWLVHVVDDDQSGRFADSGRDATATLGEQAQTLREVDGMDCNHSVVLGNPFEGICQAAEECMADLVVMGPHRPQLPIDTIAGTTAERTIRASSRPVLVAGGIPVDFYRQVLVGVDLSDGSGDAVRAVTRLGLDRRAAVSVVHVFDAVATGLMTRSLVTDEATRDYLSAEESQAAGKLASFLSGLQFHPARQIVKLNERSAAHGIRAAAQEIAADLIVVATHGRTGVSKLLLGSVAEDILRIADHDILAVPPR